MYYGKSTSELSIILDPNQMKNKNVTPQQILTALQGKETSTPAGSVTIYNEDHPLRVIGNIKSVDEI
ncbi:acriflavin resistance domain protein [Bacillus clarus]|uniref:Acriflavin resistance domain protein n=1 Tax=Bacillus clarus TaxID=2338372 RepID=A0A090ZK39_9BACI|nr:acriflavin resistance domain protein [Bacillus clarus]